MTAASVQRIIDRAKLDLEAAESDGRTPELVQRVIDDLAREDARRIYLAIVGRPGEEPDVATAQTLMASVAIANLDFAKLVETTLAPWLGPDLEAAGWDAARVHYRHLAALAGTAGIGGVA